MNRLFWVFTDLEDLSMNATEAKRISEENKISLEEVLEQIENGAKRGEEQFPICGKRITDKTRLELMRLGYKINLFIDAIGIESYMINW